jgi:hypothetical protein
MPDPVYTLERLNWRPCGPGWVRRPGSVHLQTFAGRADADAAQRQAEWDLRRRVNPFRLGGPVVSYQTRFGPERLRDWLLDAGLDPPAGPAAAPWADWWAANHARFSDAQRAAAWEALDQARFFRVVERPGPGAVYVIGTIQTGRDPVGGEGFYRRIGVTVASVAGTAAAAEAECRRREEEALQTIEPEYWPYRRQANWRAFDRDPFDPSIRDPAAALVDEFDYFGWEWHCEFREVPYHAARLPRPGEHLYVVQELGWRLLDPDEPAWRWFPTETAHVGRPVAVFPDPEGARAWARRLDGEGHELPSPFRFGPPDEWSSLDLRTVYGVLSEFALIPFTGLWSEYRADAADWARWWDEVLPRLTDADLETAWALFDRLRFHVVVPAVYGG